MSELVVAQYFARWRSITLSDRFIVEGILLDEHRGPSPALADALASRGERHYFDNSPDGPSLVLVHELAPPKQRWWLHVLLLAVTLVTTTAAGAMLAGVTPHLTSSRTLLNGLAFSVPLVAILLSHEAGHFLAARWYRVDASPPYFIPFLAQYSVLGTLGAFIRLRSPFFDRRSLFDVGVAGPLAGLAVAIPTLAVGLALSRVVPNAPSFALAHQYVRLEDGALFLGDSLLLGALRWLIAPHGVLELHAVAVAGWAGILVTMLNMMPLTQLDGGHISFAMFGRTHGKIAIAFWLVLVAMGAFVARTWWIWAVLALVIGRGSLAHPPLIAPERRLDARRRAVGYLALVLGALCFMPVPIP
ncbi:MAG: site-2 protease family protein [Gemmatimonadota bacterium]|nr:site-2 protease family protein [Gemmatimonadota bacterium]